MAKDVVIVAIWDKTKDVFTRPVLLEKGKKELKFKGRKPNKIIIPASLKDKKSLDLVKSIGSYDCKVVKAVGK